jgi:succinate-acetate transporter protein
MWELSYRNIFSAVAFSLFGLNWMAMGLWDFFTLFSANAAANQMSPGGKCFWEILWGIFAFILTVGSLWINKALTFTLAMVGIGKVLEGIGAFVPVLGQVGAGFLLVAGISALYSKLFPIWFVDS